MKHKRTMTVVAAALAGAMALAGCTGQAAGGGDTDDSTLTIWHYENEDSAMGQAWAEAIKIFEEENPDVTVDVEKQTFEQIQKNAKIVLTGDDVPDVMEFNKGNATAGQLAAQGLLTPLTDAATERGWDKTLTGSLATTATYDEQGLMGSGEWYGVPNYGEFVGVYFNKDMFADLGLEQPTTLDEFEDVLAAFKKEGITPLAEAGAEYPLGQLWYELVLAYGDRALVDDYQLFANDVDFHNDAMTKATEKLDEWIEKGYIASDSAALTAEDMGVSFIDGTYPMMVSGSWWFGRLVAETKADWGQFNFPGNELHTGLLGQPVGGPDERRLPEPGRGVHRHHAAARGPGRAGRGGWPARCGRRVGHQGRAHARAHGELPGDPGRRRPRVLPGLAGRRLLRRDRQRAAVPGEPVQDAGRGAGRAAELVRRGQGRPARWLTPL